MDDLDALLPPPQVESAVTLVPSKVRRHRHRWRQSSSVFDVASMKAPGDWVCAVCGVPEDPARSRRGRTNRSRGNAQEREWCKRLGLRRVGHFNGPEDGIGTDGLFVGQAKSLSTARFPSWLSTELAKLPRTEGRIPILGLLETPGAARDHRPRRLVVMTEEDFVSLHVGEQR